MSNEIKGLVNITTGEAILDADSRYRSRIYYGSFLPYDLSKTYPLDTFGFHSSNSRFGAIFYNWFDIYYHKCKLRFVGSNPYRVIDNLSFTSINDIITWVNINVAHTGSVFTENGIFYVYDNVSETIPIITNIYGFNAFFGALKGKKCYTSSKINKCNNLSIEWTNGYDIVAKMFNYYMGTTYTGTTLVAAGGNLACWLSTSKRSYYAMSKFVRTGLFNSAIINFKTSVGSRSVYNISTGLFENYNPLVHGYEFSIVDRRYATVDEYVLDAIIYETSFTNKRTFIKDILSANQSYVVLDYLTSIYDDIYQSIHIKPMGIDNIVINYNDHTKYDTESVCIYKESHAPYTLPKVINLASITDIDTITGRVRLNNYQFMPNFTSGAIHSASNGGDYKFPEIRFRLRDKVTNEVSHLSESYLKFEGKSTNGLSPGRMIVSR